MQPSRPRHTAKPNGLRSQASFEVIGVTAAGPPIGRWLAIVLAVLALAVVKPWSGPVTGSSQDRAAMASVTAIARSRTPTGTPVPTVDPFSAGPEIASICLDPPSWRVATIERWHDQTIRVWRAIEPVATAAGPDDARVPVTSLVSEGVIELGWCAPVVAPIRTTGSAAVEVWRRTLDGASAVRVTSQRPESEASPYGDLYGPPTAPRAAVWNDGTYVFLHRAPGGQESWFAVAVELRPATGGQS